MKGCILLLFLFAAVFFVPGGASEASEYFFGGFGRISDCCTTLNLGGGGEHVFNHDFGIGANISFLGPTQGFGEGFGVFDLYGSYHFRTRPGKWDPFAHAGYTLFFREGTASLFHLGGGFHYWISPRGGIRFEVIDRIHSDFGTYHYYSFLIGYMIRH